MLILILSQLLISRLRVGIGGRSPPESRMKKSWNMVVGIWQRVDRYFVNQILTKPLVSLYFHASTVNCFSSNGKSQLQLEMQLELTYNQYTKQIKSKVLIRLIVKDEYIVSGVGCHEGTKSQHDFCQSSLEDGNPAWETTGWKPATPMVNTKKG